MLFYDYFHHEKFSNIHVPVSLASELHNYNTCSASSNQSINLIIPSFQTNLRRFCPSVIGRFLWNSILQLIRDKPSKKSLEKHFYAGTLLNTSETLFLYFFNNLLSYFIILPSFFIKSYKFFVICNIKGHNISLSRRSLSSPSYMYIIYTL